MSKINNLILEKFFSKIPHEWKMNDLNDFIEILSGFSFDSNMFHNQEGTPLIRIRDLEIQETETYYNGNFDPEYIMSGGEVLIGMDGDFNIVKWKSKPALLNQRIMKINSKDESKLNNIFLFYQLIGILKKINDLTPQTTVKHLSINDIKNLTFPFPKIEEQQKIASILENVDNNIDKTQKIIEKYEMMKQGLIYDLFTKGIDETGKPHTEFKDSELGLIPVKWKLCDLKSTYLNPIRDFSSFSSTKLITFLDEGIPFIKSEMIKENAIEWKSVTYISKEVHQLLNKSHVKEGTILLSKIGSALGKSVVYDGIMGECNSNAAVAKIEVDPKIALNYFISYTLNYELTQKRLKNMIVSLLPRINLGDLSSLKITLPPLDEQKRITDKLVSIDNKINSEKEYLNKLQNIKTGLMQDLLTGKVRVKT